MHGSSWERSKSDLSIGDVVGRRAMFVLRNFLNRVRNRYGESEQFKRSDLMHRFALTAARSSQLNGNEHSHRHAVLFCDSDLILATPLWLRSRMTAVVVCRGTVCGPVI
jgi:hypothetical protein